MIYPQTTQFPNSLVDIHLPNLTESEVKIILVILRQTNGWIDKKTGGRKTRDRISHSQFIQKTGLCRKIISKTLKRLVDIGLISVTDYKGNILLQPEERKGKSFLFYAPTFQPVYVVSSTCVHCSPEPVYNCTYNKTNYSKINKTKLRDQHERRSYRVMSIGDVMRTSGYEVN